jgi:hypothetical protein
VYEHESPGGVFGLIALQCSDQVPVDRQIDHRVLLLQRFLNSILADIAQPSRNGGPHGLGTVRLGHRHDSDGVAPPPDLLVSSHRLAHSGQPGREAWEVHNPLIYLRMLRY